MSKVQMLRSLVKQRLTAAAEEIFGLFERTIAEYEEELCRSKEENERQRKLLDAVSNPQLRLHRADVQQLSVVKEEVPPEQQEWSSSVDQEDPAPPHIKWEQEELWISQEGEQLQGLEDDDITKFTSTLVTVKSEDDEEKPQSSQLHQRHTEQMETEAEGEDCGGAEPARNSDPDTHLQPEADVSDDWKESREPQSGVAGPQMPALAPTFVEAITKLEQTIEQLKTKRDKLRSAAVNALKTPGTSMPPAATNLAAHKRKRESSCSSSSSASSSSSTSRESSPEKKNGKHKKRHHKKGKDKKVKKRKEKFPKRVVDEGDVIQRYSVLLVHYQKCRSMKWTAKKYDIDPATIRNTAAIAEVRIAAPELDPPPRGEGQTLLKYATTVSEFINGVPELKKKITDMKKKKELLP
ncbi:uncharacterized protein LOC117245839 isoform X5 [Epinephelus lanceolatus]